MLLLTINTGSSSLKAGLYHVDQSERRELAAEFERIGKPASRLRMADAHGATLMDERNELPDHEAALHVLFDWLRRERQIGTLGGVGHRVVHGGNQYTDPQIVTDQLVSALQKIVSIDPNHLPQALAGIEAARRAFPMVPQVACFDTAFHRHMPAIAKRYPLPRHVVGPEVMRYGFHGLSYESVVRQLEMIDPRAANSRLIIAHLGNGASMAAVRDGVSVETTMGFTPTGGLMMGTRSGDLDPGVLLYLLQTREMGPDTLSQLVNREAGLLGVSSTSADMRDLLEYQATDARAAEAIELFCYQARKFIGALVAVLGGLDTLVFTGGIGEHAAPIRQRICAGLGFLGVTLDSRRNDAGESIISRADSIVSVRVIGSDEDTVIARHTARLVQERGETRVSV
jgi:acetate kinase